ncbi:MAG: hypothetical protein MJ123_08285 [Lachnospiraceae bacterium]|nr:hypothetical protein [Lachnospiraceae bacterium]
MNKEQAKVNKKIPFITDTIKASQLDRENELHLNEIYAMCNNEITLQQSKRDTTIGFYLTLVGVIGSVLTGVLGKEVQSVPSVYLQFSISLAFAVLFILGCMLTYVIIRYRVYKEIYWVTSRTLNQMMSFKRSEVTKKEVIQRLFFINLHANRNSVVVEKKNADSIQKRGLKDVDACYEIDLGKTRKKIADSAETKMFRTLVFTESVMFSLALGLAVNATLSLTPLAIFYRYPIVGVCCLIAAVAAYTYWNSVYVKKLIEVYRVFYISPEDDDYIDKKIKAFNATFQKAWFIQLYVNVDVDDVNDDYEESKAEE